MFQSGRMASQREWIVFLVMSTKIGRLKWKLAEDGSYEARHNDMVVALRNDPLCLVSMDASRDKPMGEIKGFKNLRRLEILFDEVEKQVKPGE